MDLLTSIYGDGSLKDREDAYKQAVEQYGENSAEARKAKYQGCLLYTSSVRRSSCWAAFCWEPLRVWVH